MAKHAIPVLIAGAMICSLTGCASVPPKADLRFKSDKLFEELSAGPSGGADLPAGRFLAEGKSFKFQATGAWRMSKAETQLFAERQAEQDALAAALRAAGADAAYGFTDFQTSLDGKDSGAVSRYLQVWSKGVIKWERVGKPVFTADKGVMDCAIVIRGEVVYTGEPDPSFELLVESGAGSGLLKDGAEISVSASVTRGAYLQIFSADAGRKIAWLYPGDKSQARLLGAGELLKFPSEDSPFALRVQLPEGETQSVEVLYVLATKGAPLFPGGGNMNSVMDRLARLKRSDWTMAAIPYQVVK